MTQQQAAAAQNGASGGLCRVGPSHTSLNARLAQPCFAEHGQQMLLGHATILSRLVTLGWGCGPSMQVYEWVASISRKFLWAWAAVFPA
jgi:hypothetical protein